MKNISLFFLLVPACIQVFGQQTPVNDTLIPKQHQDDTILYEPKLQGGALIDTVNIKSKTEYQPGYLNDTLRKNKEEKPKGKQH